MGGTATGSRLGLPAWARRRADQLFLRLRARPAGLAVFAASLAALVLVQGLRAGSLEAPAVAEATAVEHPALVATVVVEAHVRPGDAVDAGAPLVTLSSEAIERELSILDAEAERVIRRARLEEARVVDQEQERALRVETEMADARRRLAGAEARSTRSAALASEAESRHAETAERARGGVSTLSDLLEAEWLADSERAGREEAEALTRAGRVHVGRLEQVLEAERERPSLAAPTADAYRAELAVLQARRRALLADLQSLTVVANLSGRVVSVLPPGSAVAPGTSVAAVQPEEATEIVAFLPSDTNAMDVTTGTRVEVRGERLACAEPGVVLRRGARVEQAPGQLATLLRGSVYGTPCYISMPEGCSFGAGQVLSVRLGVGRP